MGAQVWRNRKALQQVRGRSLLPCTALRVCCSSTRFPSPQPVQTIQWDNKFRTCRSNSSGEISPLVKYSVGPKRS